MSNEMALHHELVLLPRRVESLGKRRLLLWIQLPKDRERWKLVQCELLLIEHGLPAVSKRLVGLAKYVVLLDKLILSSIRYGIRKLVQYLGVVLDESG